MGGDSGGTDMAGLSWGGCDCEWLAEKYGTPLYVIDEAIVGDRIRRYTSSTAGAYLPASVNVAYAGKAFLCGAMARLVAAEGLWLDVVSGGELHLALAAGFPASRIIFHGNNKSDEEIMLGLEAGVARLVVDGFDELTRLERLAPLASARPRIQLRITPGILARTHRAIQTGSVDTKFGFLIETGDALRAASVAASSGEVDLLGFHVHIGSQIRDLAPFRAEARAAARFAWQVWRETGFLAREINLGGGWGAGGTAGGPAVEEYVQATLGAFIGAWRRHGEPGVSAGDPVVTGRRYFWPEVFLEPGRSLVAEAGITLYTVGAIKPVPGRPPYVLVDGGMTDNPRPSLYGARYRGALAHRMTEPAAATYRLAGKTCESGDILIDGIDLPGPAIGDLVAVFDTGAYNHSMSSNYNRLPRPAVVFARDGRARLVVRRETFSDLEMCDLELGGESASVARGGRQAAAGADSTC